MASIGGVILACFAVGLLMAFIFSNDKWPPCAP